jgi:hypothetical protein
MRRWQIEGIGTVLLVSWWRIAGCLGRLVLFCSRLVIRLRRCEASLNLWIAQQNEVMWSNLLHSYFVKNVSWSARINQRSMLRVWYRSCAMQLHIEVNRVILQIGTDPAGKDIFTMRCWFSYFIVQYKTLLTLPCDLTPPQLCNIHPYIRQSWSTYPQPSSLGASKCVSKQPVYIFIFYALTMKICIRLVT